MFKLAIHWDDFRMDLAAAFGEFIGTFAFILLGLGGIQSAVYAGQASKDSANIVFMYLYEATSMGLALLFTAWMFYRATGAAFNPNISFALVLLGVIKPTRFVLYCIAQFTGAIAATAILNGLTPGPLFVRPELAEGVTIAKGVFIEAFGTMALILSVLLLAIEKHNSSFLAPIGIGLSLFSVHLWALQYTGAAVNTARAFAPCVVTGEFNREHWVYWIGPTLGALLTNILYKLVVNFDQRLFKTNGKVLSSDVVAEQATGTTANDLNVNKVNLTNEQIENGKLTV